MEDTEAIRLVKTLFDKGNSTLALLNQYIQPEVKPFKDNDELLDCLQSRTQGKDQVRDAIDELTAMCATARKDIAKRAIDPQHMSAPDNELYDMCGDLADDFKKIIADSAINWRLYTLKDAYADRPAIEYAVDGILSVPSLSVVYGAPSSLKTMLLMDLAVCIATGEKWLESISPEIEAHETNKFPVLWVDEDGGLRRTSDRFKMLGTGHKAPVDALLGYYSMPSPGLDVSDPVSMEHLRDGIKAHGSKVVFIDCLVDVSGDVDENSSSHGYGHE